MRLIDADALKEKAFGKRGGLIHAADIDNAPTIQPTDTDCWGCNCPKMERLKEQKTFSEMVHLHDTETHDKRTETHACDLISRQAVLKIVAKHIGVDGDRACLIDVGKTYGEIYALPPAQPKLIRCRDCRWWERLPENNRVGYCHAAKHSHLSKHWEISIIRTYRGDFYCADAESGTDEAD